MKFLLFSLIKTITVSLLISSTNLFAQSSNPAVADTSDIFDKIIMDRITVVGAPVWVNQIPGAASYISSEQLQQHNYSDINRVLRSVSGVNIQEEDGYGLRPNIGLRGAGLERSTKINIMEDGILSAPAPYSAPAAYYFPNVTRMSSVEVRKGSSQIKYGPNTTGGAINLISTPIPSEFSSRAKLSIGERFSNKLYANIGSTHKNVGYLIEALHMGDDGFKKLDNGGDTGFTINDFLGKFMVRTNPDASVFQRLEFKIGYNDQVSDETYLGLTREDFEITPMRRYAGSQADQINTEYMQFSARHFVLFSDAADLTTTLYRNNFSRDWYKLQSMNGASMSNVLREPTEYETALNYLRGNDSPDDALMVRSNSREYYSQGVESILGLNFDTGSAANQVELGVRLHQDEEDRFQYEDGYKMENGVMVLTSAGTPGTQANRVGSATAFSVFLQNKIEYKNWTITPGVRLEHVWFKNENYGSQDLERIGSNLQLNEYTITEFIPGIGLTYSPTETLTLISGIHKGFSPPNPGSSSDTKSEQSINYELGFRLAGTLFKTEIIGFYNDYSNLLGSDLAAGGGGGTTAQFNAGKVRVFGLEISSKTDFAELLNYSSISLPFNINYTLTNATFRTDFDSNFGPWGTVSTGDKIPFIPKHQMNTSLGFAYGDLGIHLNSVYSPQIRTVAGSGSIDPMFSTDSYLLFDASSDYQLNSNLSLFINVRNLLNNTYVVSDRPAGLRPGLPRTVTGGLKFSL